MDKNDYRYKISIAVKQSTKVWRHQIFVFAFQHSVQHDEKPSHTIYTNFNGANYAAVPYLGPPWTDFHQIWTVEAFHHALNAEITSVLYTSLAVGLQMCTYSQYYHDYQYRNVLMIY